MFPITSEFAGIRYPWYSSSTVMKWGIAAAEVRRLLPNADYIRTHRPNIFPTKGFFHDRGYIRQRRLIVEIGETLPFSDRVELCLGLPLRLGVG